MNQIKILLIFIESLQSVILKLFINIARVALQPINFSSAVASSIYVGFYLTKIWAIAATFTYLQISDFLLSFFYGYPFIGLHMLYVYPSYLVIGPLSKLVFKKTNEYLRMLVSLISSVIFFILSNFGYFLKEVHPYTWAGLWKVYVDAIPFLITDIIATNTFTSFLFNYHNLLVE